MELAARNSDPQTYHRLPFLSNPAPSANFACLAGQLVAGLRWHVGRPIEHLSTFACSFLGPGLQIGIGQNR